MRTRLLALSAVLVTLLAPVAAAGEECAATLLGADRRASIVALSRVGSSLHVASGAALSVFDITDRSAPIERGFVNLDSVAIDVAAVGTTAVVLTSAGLAFVDAADPDQPVVAGTFPIPSEWKARHLSVRGSHAFVPAADGLHVIDFADPAGATEIGALAIAQATDVVVASAQRAYLAAAGTLVTVDISNPAAPAVVSTVEIPSSAGDTLSLSPDGGRLAVWGNVSSGHHSWASIDLARLADPDLPEFRYEQDFSEKYLSAVTMAGNRAYVDDAVWNISDLTTPVVTGELLAGFVRFHATSGDPDVLYVADENGLLIEDVAVAADPQLLAAFPFPGPAIDAYVAGATAVVLDAGGLRTFDTTAAGRLEPLGDLRRGQSYPLSLARLGDHAVVEEVAQQGTTLVLVDLADPADPLPGATLPSGWHRPVVDGSLLYSGGECDVVSVYDVGDPASPLWLAQIDGGPDCYEYDFAAAGGRLYFWIYVTGYPTYQQALETYDLSLPTQPQLLGSALVDPHRGSSHARGRRLLVAEWDRLRILDATDPESPEELGQIALPPSHHGIPRDLSLYGSRLAVSTDVNVDPEVDLSPTILDLSQPAAPALWGRVPTVGTADSVALGAGVLVVADGEAGVSIYESCVPFADGFESGDLSEWTLTAGELRSSADN